MVIQRNQYISELISKQWNGKVKIVTGIRRCGKSFLLFTLYKNYLLNEGVAKDCFVELALDKKAHVKYRNPNELYEYVLRKTQNTEKRYYVFIDEIQLSYKVKSEDVDENLVPEEDRDMLYVTFYDILNDLMARSNLDIYVTGSNSKMLSKDIVTNFRDRGSEIKVYPLSFKEFYPVSGLEKVDAMEEYLTYGGMPLAVLEKNETEKRKYLKGLHKRVYIKDIVERYKLKDDEVLEALGQCSRLADEAQHLGPYHKELSGLFGGSLPVFGCTAIRCEGETVFREHTEILFDGHRTAERQVEFSTAGEIASDGERDLRRAHPQRLQRGCGCGGNDPRKGRQKATVTV